MYFGWKPPRDFGQYVGYLPQDVELFAGTIKQNIARMDDQPRDEEVVAAAKWAGCHDMVLRLPKGYDTVIGDGGHSLSGGQRQRVALARALYGDVRLLVLDEPNSSLDSDGEQALTTALLKAKRQGITIVMICHRPSLLAEADKLLMLKDGKVAMFGPLRDVMAKFANAQPTTAATTQSARQVS